MTAVVLFHHVQGLTDGMVAFADRLRAGGHTVHTPDLFEGRTFATIDEGMAHARGVGFQTIEDRGVAAAESLPKSIVYGGFSMGVMPAQKLICTRPGVLGGLLFDAALETDDSGPWPAGVSGQIHGMDADPFFDGPDLDAARTLEKDNDGVELFLYPGDQHLSADNSLAAYDADATALMVKRALAFLDRL